MNASVPHPGTTGADLLWWLGFWPAGESLYWWTTAISRQLSVDAARTVIRSSVTSKTWTSLTVPQPTPPSTSGQGRASEHNEPPAAFVAAGSIPADAVEALLRRLGNGLPGLDDATAAEVDAMDAQVRRLTGPQLPTDDPAADAATSIANLIEARLIMDRRRSIARRSTNQSLRRAWSGPLVDRAANRDVCHDLGNLLLPAVLREYLCGAGAASGVTTVLVAPGPSLSRVPWELLTVDGDDRRLIEAAVVRGGISPAALTGLARPGGPDVPDGPALRVVDPGASTPPDIGRPTQPPLYRGGTPQIWQQRTRQEPGDLLVGPEWPPPGCTREELGRLLQERRWSRLFYFGHASSGDSLSPTAAALELATPPRSQRRPATTDAGGRLESKAGVATLSARVWMHAAERWPAPHRVAFIACQSDDARYVEQLGLTLAALNAGARIVTTTRWTLPTDRSVRLVDEDDDGHAATTELALAVDDAHQAGDPARALRDWQLTRLAAWRSATSDADLRRTAPLIWASTVTYIVPEDAVHVGGSASSVDGGAGAT